MSKNKKNKKWCLVHIGNDITYGLAFVAGELKRLNHQIFWIDGDENIDTLNKVIIEKNAGSGVVPYLPLPELKKKAKE